MYFQRLHNRLFGTYVIHFFSFIYLFYRRLKPFGSLKPLEVKSYRLPRFAHTMIRLSLTKDKFLSFSSRLLQSKHLNMDYKSDSEAPYMISELHLDPVRKFELRSRRTTQHLSLSLLSVSCSLFLVTPLNLFTKERSCLEAMIRLSV